MADSLQKHLAEARTALIDAGLAPNDAALDAEVLARHVLGWDRAALLTHAREAPPAGFAPRFDELIRRRVAREPVALITGRREFWGLEFEVTRDVLVPRPETELIIEAALRLVEPRTARRMADIGTGSGCLAVALAREFPAARVIAVDTSEAALAVARRNAATHEVAARILFVRANLLDAVSGPFDLIVSNPPYVSARAALLPEVGRHEPGVALFAGDDGLGVLRTLIPAARPLLAPDGVFIVEFGFGQDDEVRAMAEAAGWRDVTFEEDLQQIPRTAVMRTRRQESEKGKGGTGDRMPLLQDHRR